MPSVGAGAAKARASGKAKRSSAQKAESGNGIVDVSDDGSEEPSTTSNGAHSGACRLPCLHFTSLLSARAAAASMRTALHGWRCASFLKEWVYGFGTAGKASQQEMTCLSDRLDVEKLTGGAQKTHCSRTMR